MPDTTTERCIRRPHSTWSHCPCTPCRELMRVTKKRQRYGYQQRASSADAAARLQSWLDAGYTASWVESVTGIPASFTQKFGEGRRHLIGPVRSRLILEADIRAGTAGFCGATGSIRRVQALARIGWTLAEMNARSGLPMANLAYLQQGVKKRVRFDVAAAVRALYDQLAMTPGPSRRAVERAAGYGWPPPLAWDDDTIDDPAATPYVDNTNRRLRGRPPAATVDDTEFLLDVDMTLTYAQVGERLGVTDSAIYRALQRHGDDVEAAARAGLGLPGPTVLDEAQTATVDQARARTDRLIARLSANGVEAGQVLSSQHMQTRRVA